MNLELEFLKYGFFQFSGNICIGILSNMIFNVHCMVKRHAKRHAKPLCGLQ